MRIIFLGSPAYVLPALEKILTLSEHQVLAVVSQPARPMGRSRSQTVDPAVAAYAKAQDLLVFQPEKINTPEMLSAFKDLKPDLAITAAYGQILSQSFLDIFTRGTINIHPSLLPAYRGATPIPSALLAGESISGVSILFTVRRLDAGNLIVQKSVDIPATAKASDLYDQLFKVGADLLPAAFFKLADATFAGSPQDDTKVSHCGKIEKEDGRINWLESAEKIYNRYRAYDPWPGIYTILDGKRLQILSCSSVPNNGDHQQPGRVSFDKKSAQLLVDCASGCLVVESVKPEGKKEMRVQDFWNGLGKRTEGAFFQ